MSAQRPRQPDRSLGAQLEACCEAFEKELVEGRSTARIEDYVTRWQGQARSRLLDELLRIEFSFRSQHGATIDRGEYERRFPDDRQVVTAAWEWFSSKGNAGGQSKADPTVTSPHRAATPHDDRDNVFRRWARELKGRFELGRVLGAGGMSFVFQATDVRTGGEVALKIMKSHLAGSAAAMFKQEFESIAAIEHPHCLQVLDYAETPLGPFFTMELFPGKPLTVLENEPLATRLHALYQTALALDFIHDRGFIHRDVKPSNVLACRGHDAGGDRRWQVKLADFGLVKFAHSANSSVGDEAFGTPQYASPEQFNRERLDHRVDLYSLAIMAHELLGGRHPFSHARTMVDFEKAHLEDTPPRLDSFVEGLPSSISDLIAAYLGKTAAERPASTRPLRAAIAAHLQLDTGRDVTAAEFRPERVTVFHTGFVCRGRELSRIEDFIDRGLNPTLRRASDESGRPPATMLVATGDPGIGKSSLIRQSMRSARAQGCRIYEGRCLQGNKASFQPFVDILKHMLARTSTSSLVDQDGSTDLRGTTMLLQETPSSQFATTVEQYSAELLRIAPELKKYLKGKAFPQSELSKETNYIYRTIAAFFVEVATIQPTYLFIDDLQWADPSTLGLLTHLVHALRHARQLYSDVPQELPRLVLCCTARGGYEHLDEYLEERGSDAEVVALQPLGRDEIRELVAMRLNCDRQRVSETLVTALDEVCGGNPFFVSETIQAWSVTRNIQLNESRWDFFEVDASQGGKLARSAHEAIRGQLGNLSAKAGELLNVAAVIGQVVDIEILFASIENMDDAEIHRATRDLIRRKVINESSDGQKLSFEHDVLRETILAGMTRLEHRALHRRVGHAYEARQESGAPVGKDTLALHFREADIPDKAYHYFLQSGEDSLEAFAIADAITKFHAADEQYVLAIERRPGDADDAQRFRILAGLGKAHLAANQITRAIEAFRQARHHATTPNATATALLGEGESHSRAGNLDAAVDVLDEALRQLGVRRWDFLPLVLADTLRSLLRVHLRPLRFRDGPSPTAERDELLSAIYLQLGDVFILFDMPRCTHITVAAVEHAASTRQASDIAQTYGWYAFFFAFAGLRPEAHWARRRAQRAAERSGLPEDLLQVSGYTGAISYFGGKPKQGAAQTTSAITDRQSAGESRWKLYMTHTIRHANTNVGHFERTVSTARQEVTIGEAINDPIASSWGHYGIADALGRRGQVELALDESDISLASIWNMGVVAIPIATHTRAFVFLQGSQYTIASELLEFARRFAVKKLVHVNDMTIRTYPLLAESLLGGHWHAAVDRRTLRRVGRVLRTARMLSWMFPNLRPQTYRMLGRAAAARGRRRSGIRWFHRAMAAAQQVDADYELARAKIDLAALDDDHRDRLLQEACEMLRELQATIPAEEAWSLEGGPLDHAEFLAERCQNVEKRIAIHAPLLENTAGNSERPS